MRHLLLTSLLLSMTPFATGCVNDGASLFITGVVSLDNECAVDDSAALLSGAVDLALTDTLTVYPVFAAQIRDRVSPNASNPSDMHVQFVDVRIEDLAGNTLAIGLDNPFRVPTSAFIEGFMGSGEVPTATGAVQILPPGYPAAVAAAAGGSALVSMRPRGRTNGGINVVGNYDFHLQINLCSGCLQRCAGADESEVIPCFPGQNDVSIVTCP